MTSYLSNLQLIWNFFLQVLKVIFDLYTKEPIFMSVFSLWVLDRVFGIFDLIKG